MSLYFMKCKRHVIALLYHYALAIVVEEIVGETTSWRHDDGDHGVMPVTKMIMVPRRWRSMEHDDIGHIMSHILIACDVYPLCILFCLERR